MCVLSFTLCRGGKWDLERLNSPRSHGCRDTNSSPLTLRPVLHRESCPILRKQFIYLGTAAAAKSLQSCLTLCDPIDGSLPGSPVPGILQARTLEWVAISFSNAWQWKVKVKSLSHVWLFMTPWTAAHQAPPSMGFSRQEYWSGVPSSSPYLGTTATNLTVIIIAHTANDSRKPRLSNRAGGSGTCH